MIKQQYYTREKSGLYSLNPGYNTIAKSESLEDAFVVKLLQEYCFYEAPFKLLNEKNYDKFPKAYTCINAPSGELVLGCSFFVPIDYEGKRSTYFTHNYVIPEEEKNSFIKNPEKIAYASGFKSSFDRTKGSILQEVTTIETNRLENDFTDLLHQLKIDKKTFKQLIMACFMSVLKNKKIYIILDVDVSLISKYAKGLIKYIYITLPYALRRKIGFITYAKDVVSKEYINLEFLPTGAIKNISIEVSSGYLFDFNLKRFLNQGLDIQNHEYLNFIWENIENRNLIDLFMDTVEELIDSRDLNIEELDEFCELFSVNNNLEASFYKDFKIQKSEAREIVLQDNFKNYIDSLEIDKMNIDEINEISFLYTCSSCENYEIIDLIKKITAVNSFLEVPEISSLVDDSFCKIRVQELIEKFYKDGSMGVSNFALISGFSGNVKLVIRFIYDNKGVEGTREFILWLCNNLMDVEATKKIVEEYINQYDNNIFKHKATRNLLLKKSSGELKIFLEKEEYKRAKGLRKILLRHLKD